MNALSFDHVGLSVCDLDAERRFYTAAFGVVEEHYAVIAEAHARVSLLRMPSGAAIELTERAGSMTRRFPDAFAAASVRGYFHWPLRVADLDEALRSAAACGARVVSEPAAAQRPDVRFAYVADPEGHLIELLQLAR
jgi:catechol 2,3-dioxygenase-like lactoylglutathione lyase family enzyme